MTSNPGQDHVPSWSGDASEFEAYATACKWYQKATKESERKLIVARLWGRLHGAAKSVVKHLDPDRFEDEGGLQRFLEVLRASPLQHLPIPDSFARLEKWNYLKRHDKESIAELIVREEELFTELQQSLTRARKDRLGSMFVDAEALGPRDRRRGGASTPSQTGGQSPVAGFDRKSDGEAEASAPPEGNMTSTIGADFFSDELRGYRLLKASRLTSQEKQNVLVQTSNSTQFYLIRRALRTLFADDHDRTSGHSKGHSRIWWADGLWDHPQDDWTVHEEQAYWNDWSPGSWSEWNDEEQYAMFSDWQGDEWREDWDGDGWHEPETIEDIVPDTHADTPEENQLREAYSIATEATRTLKEAREAVRQTRQARGYFSPESSSGKGMTPSSSPMSGSKAGKGSKGHFKGSKGRSKGFGPCFICGMHGHSYAQCPDRYSFPKGKSKKGFGKGKGKGKPQGKAYYSDISMNVFSVQWDELTTDGRHHTWAVLDTGATENAIGIDSLSDLVESGSFSYTVSREDLPTFRFGNGHTDKAVSRADIYGTSLGNISFFVLDGMARKTPPLVGARTLRDKEAMVSYGNGLFLFKEGSAGEPKSVRMQALRSGHVTINLATTVSEISPQLFSEAQDEVNHNVFMMQIEEPLNVRLQQLAQRLQGLGVRDRAVIDDGANGLRRSPTSEFPMLGQAQRSEDKKQSACNVVPVSSVRHSHLLHTKEEDGRSLSSDGARPIGDPVGHSGVGDSAHPGSMHREDREWKDDGSQGQALADGPCFRNQPQHDTGGVPEQAVEDGATTSDRRQSAGAICPGDSSPKHTSLDHHCRPTDEGSDRAGERAVEDEIERGREPSEGLDVRSKAQEDSQEERTGGDSADPLRLGGTFFGDVSGGDPKARGQGKGQERVGSLWRALRGLRERMGKGSQEDHTCTTMPSGTTTLDTTNHGKSTLSPHGIPGHHQRRMVKEAETEIDPKVQSSKNLVPPSTAQRMSRTMAALSALMLVPFQGLMTQIEGTTDFMEVACSSTSAMSQAMLDKGFVAKRVNFKEGYDLEVPRGTRLLDLEVKSNPPKFSWISLPCTRLSGLQNLTERTAEEWARFEQRLQRDLRRAEDVAETFGENLKVRSDSDLAWEWPTGCKKGWDSKAIQKLLRKIREAGKTAYWCRFHGCAYGLTYKDWPVQKGWTVLTTSKQLWLALQRKCPGHQEHVHCRGEVAKASSYYPAQMVAASTKAIIGSWTKPESDFNISLATDVETYLLEMKPNKEEVLVDVRKEEPTIMALTRNRYPKEAPSGKKLEAIRQQMMRIHRSSGHSSFTNLQRLLRIRKAPSWAIELAGNLQCPDCIESRKPQLHPPSSTSSIPELFEIVGVDVFEFENEEKQEDEEESIRKKHKFLIWRDRASGFVYVDHLMEYSGSWEPKTHHVLRSLTNWLLINPSPKWIMSDSGTIFTSDEFLTFAGRSGIGVLTAPAEAHWMMGAEEGTIGVLKSSVKKLLKEEQQLSVRDAFLLAAHGHNNTIGASGFSPFQWVRGGACPQEDLPVGLDPKKAFSGLLRLKEKARVAYEQENAKAKLSKLGNAVTRPPTSYKAGDLVMIWRQRMKPGKTGGHWTGPVRVLLQERGTLWLATGATLLKARVNQVRTCSRREELQAMLTGAAIYKQPVNIDTLLRSFTGKHYTNITGETPSFQQQLQDVSGTNVHVEHRPEKFDSGEPGRGQKRKEAPGAEADDEHEDYDQRKSRGVEASASYEVEGEAIPSTELNTALGDKGPNVVDGIPADDVADDLGNKCAVPGCELPGGHSGPHKSGDGSLFAWTPYEGRLPVEEENSSSSSSSSEELATTPRKRKKQSGEVSEGSVMYVFEIEVTNEDQEFLRKHPRKATIWLSKRMQEKSKEHQWSKLPLERKEEFDLAQAKELSNVLQSKALRSLTRQEWNDLDKKSIMQMRWILTTKQDGSAKARLVVLGFQQHNLTEVQASAPTMNRVSRNMLLAMVANRKFCLRSGDVTSAFLQATQSLEEQELYVWAPAELAVLYGASPEHPMLPLKVCRAFYGLVNSPRKWFEHMTGTLEGIGWKPLLSDPCVFFLEDDGGTIVGYAGLHVDDIMIGGDPNSAKFAMAQDKLESSYRWGKWDVGSFTFAGCKITQNDDFSIRVDQKEYTEKWLEEIEIEKGRPAKSAATDQEISQLRGVIGTVAWRSSQTSPQFQADANLLLSEIPYATVETLQRANKLVRELRRNAEQALVFHSWNLDWKDLTIVVWADASNGNRPDRSSTMGIVAGLAPKEFLLGDECAVSLIQWRSSKTPRQCLGSNGAEVQSITEGEDTCFRLRAMLAEINGQQIKRHDLYDLVARTTSGAVVMDSRGIYDAMVRNVSSLHGLRSGRAGYELAISVAQAKQINTNLRWVNGDAQLGDSLTKAGARRVMLQFFSQNQRWRLIHDDKFTAGKKMRKKELERKLQEADDHFVGLIAQMARQNRLPWDDEPQELRNGGDEITQIKHD